MHAERSEITHASVVAQRESAVSSTVEGEAVILSIDSGRFYRLNGVGSRIWRALEAETEVAKLCDWAIGAFDVDPAACEREVFQFLNEINDQGLLTVR